MVHLCTVFKYLNFLEVLVKYSILTQVYFFGQDLEPVITEYSETLLRKLDDDDKEINHLLARIERDEVKD